MNNLWCVYQRLLIFCEYRKLEITEESAKEPSSDSVISILNVSGSYVVSGNGPEKNSTFSFLIINPYHQDIKKINNIRKK